MKKFALYIFTIITCIFIGSSGMYVIMKYYNPEMKVINQSEVTVTDEGISYGVNNIYDAVLVIENYKGEELIGTGTGFVYKTDDEFAYIMTNHHVIESSEVIKVTYSDNTYADATLVGSEEYSDIAVLKVDKSTILKVATIKESNTLNVGDTVFTIGSPMGKEFKGTITRGILSGKDRLISVSVKTTNVSDWIMKVIQTDAAINPGNSGGPLCNINGDVIGITSMKVVESSIEGIGFAIPIEDAKVIADSIITGNLSRPYIGIEMISASEKEEINNLGINNIEGITNGVVVAGVFDNSPALEVGLQKGDVIVEVGEYTVNNVAEFRYYLFKYEAGEVINIKINRNNEFIDLSIKLGKSS